MKATPRLDRNVIDDDFASIDESFVPLSKPVPPDVVRDLRRLASPAIPDVGPSRLKDSIVAILTRLPHPAQRIAAAVIRRIWRGFASA